ncbi:MAG: serine hydroxymethyltransferase [Emergencia sp.]|jgi:glycine hydroxymethyltransferase|uniref:Serine hydroxymethyltransferase n=1 Tax=Anaerotruncus colihominis TaxID=169435 RepID=A0A845QPJ8_9FIRM|nr:MULTISPECIES: serine hydroxymethyltransferase [Clostridia]MCI9475730.1 serine hydroxymethyltransferase [Emergencia sp.]MCI9638846.1 serine hydroxymethyltransferase [Emergencia sp.]NBH61958.1 serine hydroxymethyltransferase [Anaerotruncus colihominis]NCE97610.1 serine hydroxymethyltransferase [Emergencia sp. 1XD21-10]NCF02613.1 serine hydroxymethyltransferase [Anaerotruncus sp. 80]
MFNREGADNSTYNVENFEFIKKSSPVVGNLIEKEYNRQKNNIELIASENYCSEAVLAACGSCLSWKYAEGYPYVRTSGNTSRYYGGTKFVDELEEYCCDMWRKVFDTDYHVNVQPHSGSQANFAAYKAILQPGDTILSLSLDNGGHLTHGSGVNFSGKLYNMVFYDVDENGFIDMEDVRKKAQEYKPQLILTGASAYSRIIDFAAFAEIAKEAGAYFMVDMAHIAGLVAGGAHPSPFGHADIVTTTTHKTLRGPRGGLIFARQDLAKKVDSAVFPYAQGGPLEHVIAGKAVCAEEALRPEYKEYAAQVVANCKAFADEFLKLGYKIVTGGTDNHVFLLDLLEFPFSGKDLQDKLDEVGITLNKNCVPGEKRSPKETSGVRIGTAPMTTRGYKEEDFREVARKIDAVIKEML